MQYPILQKYKGTTFFQYKNCYPSQSFSRFLWVDLHQAYKLPPGLCEEQLYCMLMVAFNWSDPNVNFPYFPSIINSKGYNRNSITEIMDELYPALLELNPELKTIKVSNFMDRFHVVSGVLSRFSVADIDFFINSWQKMNASERFLFNLKYFWTGLAGWVVSPDSAKKLVGWK